MIGGGFTFEVYPPLLKSARVAKMQRSCRHDACAHREYSRRPSSYHGKNTIHRSRRFMPKTSSSLELYKYRNEKQPTWEYKNEDVYI
jgi:hypothetical protein